MAIDQDKLNDFLGKFVADFGATFHAGMVVIGEKLGLYKALAKKPMTPKELAAATSTDERYVREWLSSQAAGGYVSYNPLTRAFSLSEEQAFTLAEEGGPAYLPGAFELALAALKAVPRITEAFKTGRLRARRFHHPHGAGLPEFELYRLRLPRALDRARLSRGQAGGIHQRAREVRGGGGEGIPRP